MPYARYETWFAAVLLLCLSYMSSEPLSYPGAMEGYFFRLREGPKISQPDVYGLIVILNCYRTMAGHG